MGRNSFSHSDQKILKRNSTLIVKAESQALSHISSNSSEPFKDISNDQKETKTKLTTDQLIKKISYELP
jgi:hypothetical protein